MSGKTAFVVIVIEVARGVGIFVGGVASVGTGAAAAELPSELLRPPCVSCQQMPEATRALFSEADWKRLDAGEVVIVDRAPKTTDREGGDSASHETEAAVIVPRPAAEVWAVLVDFESRPRVLPNVSEARIERVEDNHAWVRQRVNVFLMQIRYTMIITLDPIHGLITCVLDRASPHNVLDTSGSWQVFPYSASATLLLSRDRIDTGKRVPRMIENYLVKQSLPRMMISLRDEVERRASAGPGVR